MSLRHSLVVVPFACLCWAFSVPSSAAETEVDGVWRLVSVNQNGKDTTANLKNKIVLTRKDGKQHMTEDGKPFSVTTYELRLDKNPRQYIATLTDKPNAPPLLHIYKVEGDVMVMSKYNDPVRRAKDVPPNFEPGPGITITRYLRLEKP